LSRTAIYWSKRSYRCNRSRGYRGYGTHWFYRPIGRADWSNGSYGPRFNGCYRIIWNQRNYWCYRFARSYGKHRVDWSARGYRIARLYWYRFYGGYRGYRAARPNRAGWSYRNGRPSRSYWIDWAYRSERVWSYRINWNRGANWGYWLDWCCWINWSYWNRRKPRFYRSYRFKR
jgi:hypothetical protein